MSGRPKPSTIKFSSVHELKPVDELSVHELSPLRHAALHEGSDRAIESPSIGPHAR